MKTILSSYLHRQNINPLINTEPNKDLKTIVLIPAYNEPELILSLESLKNTTPPAFPTEVIILINHNNLTDNSIKQINKNTFIKVNEWIENNNSKKLKFYCLLKNNLPIKHSGVGLARKIIMDEAIYRFNKINNTNGILVSLDADTLVSKNYLKDIQNTFIKTPDLICTTFYFEHILSNLDNKNKNAIILYELYLRYFKQGLKFSKFPYAFHTIGSGFAVKASAYAKQGGMNKKQGGEDFYFLHKIFPLGNYKDINNIKVYPSARLSNRVPFGTGPAINKIIKENRLLTYNPIYFYYLKILFKNTNSLYSANNNTIANVFYKLDNSLQEFIQLEYFTKKINEINSNSSTFRNFENRFFQWFNAFYIIKYLNYTNKNTNIKYAAIELLSYNNIKYKDKSLFNLLTFFRELEQV